MCACVGMRVCVFVFMCLYLCVCVRAGVFVCFFVCGPSGSFKMQPGFSRSANTSDCMIGNKWCKALFSSTPSVQNVLKSSNLCYTV